MTWDHLKLDYTKHGLVLVLGAGVSVASGLPDWPTLLQRAITGNVPDVPGVGDLLAHGLTLTAIASLIRERLPADKDFVTCIREALYQGFAARPRENSIPEWRRFMRETKRANPTLRAVAALCAVRNTAGRFDPNPRIHGVVNFNLDSVLEAFTYARYEKRLLRVVERPTARPIQDKINSYHIHGYLRFDEDWRNPARSAEAEQETFVLAEQDYYDFASQPTSVFNYTFLHLLREYPCCFIGHSMLDENVRRLLHLSASEQRNALRREGAPEEQIARHYAILKTSGRPELDGAVETTLLPLGVRPLWVAQFADIPTRLGEVYAAAGNSWLSVYGRDPRPA